jgi:hypothetical protein
VEFACTVFSVKLTEILKEKFFKNHEKIIKFVPNLREICLSQIYQLKNTYTHKHTHISNMISVCKAKYLLSHIQFSCFPMKPLSVALVKFHTNNHSCIATATRHAVRPVVCIYWWFIVCYIFYTFIFLYNRNVTQPLFTRYQSTQTHTHTHTHKHTGRITNWTMAHSHSTALL